MKQQIDHLDPQWLKYLKAEFEKPYMLTLNSFLHAQKNQGLTVCPPEENVFTALNVTPIDKTNVVILGQDPYHGEQQAHGLSFSVPQGMPIPPSLKNIYKELQTDCLCQMPESGNLMPWARQGVLLLNSVLTVEQSKAASHSGQGWETFTDQVISVLNDHTSHLVFILWGAYAQKKGRVIDQTKHLVLQGPHPSPLSAYRGFFGCQHFSKANQYLQKHGRAAIDWQIS